MDRIYVIIGETEEVGQSRIGGDFESTFHKEPIGFVKTKEEAKEYISSQKLAKVKKKPYSGSEYYKGGYYDMEYEEIFEL